MRDYSCHTVSSIIDAFEKNVRIFTLRLKHVMHAVFSNSRRETVQVAIPRGSPIIGKLYYKSLRKC